MRISKRTIALAIISSIVTSITIFTAAVSIPTPVSGFFPYTCNTCGPHESITGNGIGDLICSNGISYPNTQINFNAIVPK